MPEYLAPGVFIEEVNSGPRPIEGVSTSTAAFIGFAPYALRRNINRPVLITSWSQYVDTFGKPDKDGRKNPHMPGAYLSYSVQGFFQNGGSRCYVICVMPPDAGERSAATVAIPSASSEADKLFTVTAANFDTDIEVAIEPGENGTFTLKAREAGEDEWAEEIANLSLRPAPDKSDGNVPPATEPGGEPTSEPKSPRPARGQTNSRASFSVNSKLIKVDVKAARDAAPTDPNPRPGVYTIDVFQESGRDVVAKEYIDGSPSDRSGFEGLQLTDDVSIVCAPDLLSRMAHPNREVTDDRVSSMQRTMVEHCAFMGNRVAILDTPLKLSPQGARDWRLKYANYPDVVAKFAALYYPWVMVDGPDGRPFPVPPSGHIAGVYARTDRDRGVHKAPANEGVLGIQRVAVEITKGEQEVLNPLGINCIRTFVGRGTLVWGARTLSSDAAWRYINVRRLFNYIERSIERSIQWVVFEPNDLDLWARVRRDVSAFLTRCWRDGMLFGRAPEQAFYVKVDEELNPPDSRDVGLLIIEIGIAPVKPAEFVVFRFKQIMSEA